LSVQDVAGRNAGYCKLESLDLRVPHWRLLRQSQETLGR